MSVRVLLDRLSVTVLLGIIYSAMGAQNARSFVRDIDNDGYQCTEPYIVFNASAVRSKTECSQLCALNLDECYGFFYNQFKSKCTGCRAGFLTNLTVWTDSKFYYNEWAPHYETPCTTDSDCIFPNTKCYNLTCDCVESYRREPSNKTCVKFCQSYGSTYIAYPNTKLAIPGTTSYTVMNVTECLNICSNSTDCLGVNFYKPPLMCGIKLYEQYDISTDADFLTDENFDLYTRNCDGTL